MKILYCIGILILFSASSQSQSTTVYSFKLDTISHAKQIDFSGFSGKKILIVNAGRLHPDFNYSQWEQLKSLQAQHNNLLIIILPSTEITDNEVAAFFQHTSFPLVVCSKSTANKSTVNELYNWLGQKSSNGLIDVNSQAVLQKYLINEQGKLIEVFSPSGVTIIRSN